jgi:hypothetical protein
MVRNEDNVEGSAALEATHGITDQQQSFSSKWRYMMVLAAPSGIIHSLY